MSMKTTGISMFKARNILYRASSDLLKPRIAQNMQSVYGSQAIGKSL